MAIESLFALVTDRTNGEDGAAGVEELARAVEEALLSGVEGLLDTNDHQEYRFYLRERLSDSNWTDSVNTDPQLIRDYFYRFLYQPKDREYPDLCQLTDLNEKSLMENLRARFQVLGRFRSGCLQLPWSRNVTLGQVRFKLSYAWKRLG